MNSGFLVWVHGPRGPQPQRWSERPQATGSDYWSERGGNIVHVVEIGAGDACLSLDDLARKYPAPSEVHAVTASSGEDQACA